MKVDVSCILRDQWNTLGGSFFGWASDLFFFIAVPVLLAGLAMRAGVIFPAEVYGYSLTVFSIFSALLITAQIAIFGLFQNQTGFPSDGEIESISMVRERRMSKRCRENLKQLNSNISYLTLLSCISASFVLAFVAFEVSPRLETFLAVLLYGHFASSLAMVLKRFHIVFESEYNKNIQ